MDPPRLTRARPSRRPRILVLGNEKGGSGKSTTAAHLIVALLKRGFSVGSIDLDASQGTLSRLLENRADYAKCKGLPPSVGSGASGLHRLRLRSSRPIADNNRVDSQRTSMRRAQRYSRCGCT